MEERLAVHGPDGTLWFLDGEALQLYREGKLDLSRKPMTPEQEKRLAERLRDFQQMMEDLDKKESKAE